MPVKKNTIQNFGTADSGIAKSLIIFALPLMLSSLLQQLYNTIDALIVGRFLTATALAAVGSSSLLINILIYFFIGLSTGASVLISQAVGRGDKSRVSIAVHTAYALSLIAGLVLMLIGWFGASLFLTWMNTPKSGMPDAVIYVKLYCLGMIPMAVYNMTSGIFRADGDTKTPLIYLAVGVALHLVLDLLFIAVWHFGTGGAAMATTLSQIVPAVLMTVKLGRRDDALKLTIKQLGIEGRTTKEICAIGIPAGLQSVLMNFANVIVQSQINTFGITVMAGFTAYYKVEGFLFMSIEALALAISNFIGLYYGAGDFASMKKSRNVCIALNVGITVILTILYLIFAHGLISIFSNDAKVIAYGVKQIYWCMPLYFIYAYNQTTAGSLRGVGKTFVPMIISMLCICGLRVAWIMAGLYGFGFHDPRVIYTAYPITWIATGIALTIYHLYTVKNLKKKNDIKKAPAAQ